MAVADASFKTSIDSILLGSNVESGLVVLFPKPVEVVMALPRIGKPSITYKGSLLALIEVPPRILIFTAESGPPSEETICTPDILPARAPSNESVCILLISSDFIDEIAPVRSFRLVVPYPMTTTSSSFAASSIN